MSKEAMKLAIDALEKVMTELLAVRDEIAERGGRPTTNVFHQRLWDSSFKAYTDYAMPAASAIREALAKQEQGEPLPDFYITERTADSIYKLKSLDWALCISGNKGPTMHKNIPVFVGYVKTKPVEQEQGEPVAFEEWLSKQHGDPEEIGFLQALRIAYISGQDSITTPQPKQVQEPTEAQIALLDPWMRQAAAKELLTQVLGLSQPADPLYTTPQQRTWEGLSVFEINDLVENTEYDDYSDLVERTEAKLKEKNT